jgi:hypothetical protein
MMYLARQMAQQSRDGSGANAAEDVEDTEKDRNGSVRLRILRVRQQ